MHTVATYNYCSTKLQCLSLSLFDSILKGIVSFDQVTGNRQASSTVLQQYQFKGNQLVFYCR